jgi:hypothetical protein
MAKATIRELLRDFASVRRRADAGEIVRVQGKNGSYIFKAESGGAGGLLGCCSALAPRRRSAAGPLESPDAWLANR